MSRALWRLPRATRGYSTAAADESVLRGWLDRNAARPVQKTLSRLEAEQCTLLSTTLHDNARDFAPGDVLPPMWHIIFGNARYTLKQLGPDGHGADIHPPGFNRRMWAGGRMLFNTANPPRLNADHTFSLSYSPDYKIRAGKRGPMVFVEEIREVANAEGWCVREKRDVVYLSAGPPEAKTEKKDAAPKAEKPKADKPAPEPAQADFTRVVVPNETMLFRFSALTWNSHRIHYDFPYVTQVEGYKGLVTHGPLVSTLLLDAIHQQVPHLGSNVPSPLPLQASHLKSWTYRALNPWIVGQPVVIKGKFDADGNGAELWAENEKGVRGMEGRVTW